jgi:methyltransferase-like protein
MEVEQPQATATAHPNQEYIDDLDRLLKAAAHPRSVALLQKALEEVEREAVGNGAAKDSKSVTKQRTAGVPVTRSTHKISQYGKTTGKPSVSMGRLTSSAHNTAPLICRYVYVCTLLKGWDQTSKVIKIYITSISDLSRASNDDVRGKFKDK